MQFRWKMGKRWRLVLFLVVLVAGWRMLPAWGIFSGRNLLGTIVHQLPPPEFLPPATAPNEVRRGLSHPGFESAKLMGELVLMPRAIRHGHAFWRGRCPLDENTRKALAAVLNDPSTYEEWWGESGCGGFHADWYLAWGAGDSRRESMICEGCHEVLLFREGLVIRCQLSREGFERITRLTDLKSL